MSKETQYATELRDILRKIALALDCKHTVQIDVDEMALSVAVEIEVHADDYGKLCGTGGVMINALKLFVETAGTNNGRRSRLVLNKPIPGNIGPRPRFQEATNWDSEPIRLLCERAAKLVIPAGFRVVAHDRAETTTLEVIAVSNGPAFAQIKPNAEKALATIFHAVGKVMGRNEVVVNVGSKCKPQAAY